MLAGLAGESIPFAFQVIGAPDGVRFSIGTWSVEQDAGLDQQHKVLASLLDGAYPSMDRTVQAIDSNLLAPMKLGGLAYGVPNGEVRDGDAPWDRLLRGLHGGVFAVVVLAEPIDLVTIAKLRDIALDDQRAALAASETRGELPLTRAYSRHVEELTESLNRGLAIGAWRTGVYLLGDIGSYWRLAAAWRAQFSSDRPQSPLRVLPLPEAQKLAGNWALPYQPAPPGPRIWRHPFLNQSLLDTRQLAAMVHFPRRDSSGFSVRSAPPFAVSRPVQQNIQKAVEVGEILDQQRKTNTTYRTELDQFTRHAFVSGLTGSGKTNTVMHLLMQAAAADVPFLVIEPAKTEYRELLGQKGLADKLRVFTLGREQVAPLRMNPFEIPPGVDVSTHLDLLKAVFMGSFALWIPLPQILEQCLVELYTERGWDFTTGRHGSSDVTPKVPTIGELVAAVERTVPKLGYKGETTQEMTASLTTRLNGLRRGTRGLMLDVERSVPIGELLSAPTIIELEGIGDDDDKAFIMGLLLVRLYEHRRAEYSARLATAAAANLPVPPGNPLSHIVVIEEAHRLLSGGKKLEDSWHADPRGAFSDAFSQMLSEVRAYGQGMIIADQVPVRLAPDVLKNTNLKIVHRLVAGDDREAMALAMSMDEEQSKILSTLPRGRAAVFSEGDHSPVMVAVPKAKDLGVAIAIDDAKVAAVMTKWRSRPEIEAYFEESQFHSLAGQTPGQWRDARALAESSDGRLLGIRLFNTAVAATDGLDVVWPDVVAFVAARTPFGEDLSERVHAFALQVLHITVARRAVQGRWPKAAVDLLTSAMRDSVGERINSNQLWLGATASRGLMMERAKELMRRTHDPYLLCTVICADQLCRYRDVLKDVLAEEPHAAFGADVNLQSEPQKYVVRVAGTAAGDVIAVSPSAPNGGEALDNARWRATGCAAQIKFCDASPSEEAADLVASALSAAGWQVTRPKPVSIGTIRKETL
ncbi:DUF87 domain-containing protein [Rhizobium sp. RCAM05973]|uniref:ATP-binding protein n=1 Tax=Rhizobium sp. RCAM05973 TaxID=2994066 RepID=UPI0022EBAD88